MHEAMIATRRFKLLFPPSFEAHDEKPIYTSAGSTLMARKNADYIA